MRPLAKAPMPSVLATQAENWTRAYTEALAAGVKPPTPWRHPEILSTLMEETLNKCAYCEGIIADVSYPHVEHVLPKASRPDLVVEWSNLTLACPVCNASKGDYYDPPAPLISPYRDRIDEHLAFLGPAIVAPLESEMGERSIQRLKLMRAPLLMERMKRIESIHQRLKLWQQAEEPDKTMFGDLVLESIDNAAEFAQCLRAYVASMGFPV